MMQTRGQHRGGHRAGIDTGSKQYVAGLDKINAAKDKLSDARDRLEEIDAQRGELSARELHKARNEVKSLTTAGMENLIQAAMAERKINRAEAIAFVEQQIKVSEGSKDRTSREKVAQISAAPSLERNKLLQLANNKDDKVRKEYGKLQAKVMDTLSKDPNYTMANPMQQQVLQTTALRQALMSNPFLAPYAAGIGFSSAPTGGKVYDLTTD
jgi:hypothetical protein